MPASAPRKSRKRTEAEKGCGRGVVDVAGPLVVLRARALSSSRALRSRCWRGCRAFAQMFIYAAMPRPRSAPDLYLLSKVSTLYYLRDQTQQEIAERLRLSRPAVSRLLRDAQNHGIVQITISPPRGLL